jgi:hypothetical protein
MEAPCLVNLQIGEHDVGAPQLLRVPRQFVGAQAIDPGVRDCALPGRRGKTQQRLPLALPGGDIPQGVPGLRQCAQIVMGRHQALEARLLGRGDRLQDDLAQVHAWVLGLRLLRHGIPAMSDVAQNRGQPRGKTVNLG